MNSRCHHDSPQSSFTIGTAQQSSRQHRVEHLQLADPNANAAPYGVFHLIILAAAFPHPTASRAIVRTWPYLFAKKSIEFRLTRSHALRHRVVVRHELPGPTAAVAVTDHPTILAELARTSAPPTRHMLPSGRVAIRAGLHDSTVVRPIPTPIAVAACLGGHSNRESSPKLRNRRAVQGLSQLLLSLVSNQRSRFIT